MLFQAPEAALSATATPVFESILLLAFKRALAAYCTQVAPLPQRIRVTVGTAEPVAGSVRARFHIVARGLVGSHRVGVVFEAGVVATGYRIDIDPPAPPGTAAAKPESKPEPESGPGPRPGAKPESKPGQDAGPDEEQPGPTTGLGPAATPTVPRQHGAPPRIGAAELTLRYGDWVWRYTLPDADMWVPLGRGLRLDDRRAVVRLPDHMAAVPRGALLLIRYSGGETQLCRSEERREYLIDVDGRRLSPGTPQRIRPGGRISYTRGGPATGLEYHLAARH